jgi:hypothetical protein
MAGRRQKVPKKVFLVVACAGIPRVLSVSCLSREGVLPGFFVFFLGVVSAPLGDCVSGGLLRSCTKMGDT